MSADSDRSRDAQSIFDGLHDLADALHSMADEARSFEQSVSFGEGSGGIVRVEVQTDIGDRSHTTADTSTTARSAAEETKEGRPVRRPAIDVQEGDDHVRIVAEMPGATEDEVEWAVEGRALSLEAPTDRVRYARVVELPVLVADEEATLAVEAGVVTLTFPLPSDNE